MNLHEVLEELAKLGYPAVALFGEGDSIAAIVVAESETTLMIGMAQPEKWDIWRSKCETTP